MPLIRPIKLKTLGELNKYHPTGKNDIKAIVAINIGFRFVEATNPKKLKNTINIPGVVIMFDTSSVEYGLRNHITSHNKRARTHK